MRMFCWISVLALLLSGASPSLGGQRSYLVCEGGDWSAVGRPSYKTPMRQCDVPIEALPDTEVACRAEGGTWGPIGIFAAAVCRLPTADANRICGDDGECESSCLAELSQGQLDRLQRGVAVPTLGRCAPVRPVVGCIAVVRRGTVDALLCLD